MSSRSCSQLSTAIANKWFSIRYTDAATEFGEVCTYNISHCQPG
jgi:hypothetical protein